MRLLLTGGTGFLGSCFLKASKDFEIIAVGRTRPADFTGDWIEADLSQPLSPHRLPASIDAVVHLVQSNQYRRFPDGAADMLAVNVNSTASLLNWALTAGAKTFLYASTGNVYGAHQKPARETDPTDVRGDYYGATKLAAESLIAGYSKALNTCSLRLYGLYGPGQPNDKMLGTLIERVKTGTPITLQGSAGGYVTQPTYTPDVVSVIHRALADTWHGPVNVAGPEAASIETLGTLIGATLQKTPVFQRVDGEPPAPRLPDLTHLHTLLPDMTFTSLSDGIRHTVGYTGA